MRDAVTTLIKNYDVTGRYLDRNAMDELKAYFDSGSARIAAASLINTSSSDIVKKAAALLFEEVPELIRPSGNAYTTRRFSACLRDMDYYLRYATYALIAANMNVLDERVLQGLRETYNSLDVPIGSTVRGIQIMKDLAKEQAIAAGVANAAFVDEPFDYITRELSEQNI